MTKKRFYLNQGEVDILKIIDFKENNEAIYRTISKSDMKMVVGLLNELSEENEQLKEDYDYLEKRFKEEEWHYDYIDEDRDAWRHKCQELEKENEKSKQKIESIKEILNEDIGYIESLRKIEEALK